MNSRVIAVALVSFALLAPTRPAFSQNVPGSTRPLIIVRYQCPGDPPLNLASFHCGFTKWMRLEHFFSASVTDQAIVGAAFTGLFAQLRKDPPEWRRDLDGYGRRVASRYQRKILGGGAQMGVGFLMKTDPRHVTFAADPLRGACHDALPPPGGAWERVGHALGDWATVRRSSKTACGARLANVPLLAGALANGFIGRRWYPAREKTLSASLRRGAGPLETALAGSIYAVSGPEVARAIGAVFKRHAKPAPLPAAGGKQP